MQHIGYTKKPKGLDGSLKVKIFDEYLEDFAQTEVLFLEINGREIPYFIEKVELQKELVVQLEEINDRNAAAQLVNKSIYLRNEDIIADEERQLEVAELAYAHLVDFLLTDTELGEVGKIAEVIEMPQQEMAVVNYHEKEVLIPLNDQLIQGIDTAARVVTVQLPAGLLELF